LPRRCGNFFCIFQDQLAAHADDLFVKVAVHAFQVV
jgi:hypothetical protein